mgnify:CR=1 FL=1
MQYEGQICRPPMERASYMLPVAVGCSYNACKFCMLFKHLSYRELPREQIEAEMQRYLNEVKQPFADQDAWNKFGIENDKIVKAPVRFNECISCGFTDNPAIVHYCAIPDWYESHYMNRREYLDKYR